MSKKPLEEVRGWTVGKLAALVHAIGGSEAAEKVLKDNGLRKQVADLTAAAKSAIETAKFAVLGIFSTANGAVFSTANGAVRISYIDAYFKSWFYGMNEADNAAIPRRHHELARGSLDVEIIADLGGEEKAEVTLAGIYRLMELQPNGEDGDLLNNGRRNIFFVRDSSGVLRSVYMYWDVGGWRVFALTVGAQGGWHAGSRVFSR